ncbi:MAG: nicotinate (nicotinamide) nucleotide adenylyltransferase [Bdellovibrionota bacterium]
MIALLGGSFNPPHLCHLLAAGLVLGEPDCEECWLVPALSHPFGKELLPFGERLALCEAMATPFGSRISVCGIEGELGGTSYTVQTLEALRSKHPDKKFAWVIGSDNVADLPKWKEAERLPSLCSLWVVGRGGVDVTLPSTLRRVGGISLPAISSTDIRSRVKEGKPIAGLVTAEVARRIAERGLYR